LTRLLAQFSRCWHASLHVLNMRRELVQPFSRCYMSPSRRRPKAKPSMVGVYPLFCTIPNIFARGAKSLKTCSKADLPLRFNLS
jgi:hypothetical protein